MLVLTPHPVAKKIAELLEPHIERQGYELVAVEYRKGTRSSLVRLLVDKPGGGIALDDLEKLSPVLSDLLDVYDPVAGATRWRSRHRGSTGRFASWSTSRRCAEARQNPNASGARRSEVVHRQAGRGERVRYRN